MTTVHHSPIEIVIADVVVDLLVVVWVLLVHSEAGILLC